MKIKSLALVLTVLLIVPLFAQKNTDQVYEGLIEKPIATDTMPDFTPQVMKGEKPGVIITSVFVMGDGEVEDLYDVNMIDYDTTTDVYFFVTYTAMWNTNVKFHFVITGPQYYSYTTSTYKPRYNNKSYVYLYGGKKNFFTKKGLYKLIVYAEQMSPFGGEAIVGTCNFRVY